MTLPYFGTQKEMLRLSSSVFQLLQVTDTITVMSKSPFDGSILIGTTRGLFSYEYAWVENVGVSSIQQQIDKENIASGTVRWNVLDLAFADFQPEWN